MRLLFTSFILFNVNILFGQVSKDTIVTFKHFTIETPVDWKQVKFKGVDSYVGGLTNGTDTLRFDYGLYSANINAQEDECRVSYRIQDFRIAKLARQRDSKGLTAIRLKRNKKVSLIIYGYNVKDEKTILRILKTVKLI